MNNPKRFQLQLRQGDSDTKVISLECTVSPNMKQQLDHEHHDLQAGVHGLKRMLGLLKAGYHLNPQSQTDYVISFEKALKQVLPVLESVSQLYDRARIEVSGRSVLSSSPDVSLPQKGAES